MRASLIAFALILASCATAVAQNTQGDAIQAFYPEGPLYQNGKLYYAEMGSDRVTEVVGRARRTFFLQPGCGPTALAPYGDGFLVLCHIGARVVAVDASGRELRRWTADAEGNRLMDPNDCTADGRGGVYFSDPGQFARNTRPHGRVMHLSADGTLRAVAQQLWYPNGVFVDRAHNQLYVSEHMSAHVMRYDIRADGGIEGPDVFADLSNAPPRSTRYETSYAETGPDGLEMSADGDLWVVEYGGGRVLRYSPEGRVVGQIELPTRYSTNIAFAPDGSAVTTGAFDNLTQPYPGEVRFHAPQALTRAPE